MKDASAAQTARDANKTAGATLHQDVNDHAAAQHKTQAQQNACIINFTLPQRDCGARAAPISKASKEALRNGALPTA